MVETAETFEISTVISGDVGSVLVAGDLDITSAPRLITVLHDLARSALRRIELDCRRVEFVDSAGLRALIVGRNEAHGMGTDLALVRTSLSMSRLLDVTGLAPILLSA
jgi:anti-sigma B factor antagonist